MQVSKTGFGKPNHITGMPTLKQACTCLCDCLKFPKFVLQEEVNVYCSIYLNNVFLCRFYLLICKYKVIKFC